jgi:MoxR-like ATPase
MTISSSSRAHREGRARLGASAPRRLDGAAPEAASMPLAGVAGIGRRLWTSVSRAVEIADHTLEVVLAALLAGGHVLIEDQPGVGKTLLARALAASIGGRFARIQATVDLLPGDVVGANVWRQADGVFEFRPGPIFANVVLVDEINRATPRTQSGLLEAMEERQVTVEGDTRPIPAPFNVIATQNPTVGYDGTYALPQASLDRFLARVSLGYPSRSAELRLLADKPGQAAGVATPETLIAVQDAVASVHASDRLLEYVVDLVSHTRRHDEIAVGASPRAGVMLLAAARARAALRGRDHVLADYVKALAPAVLAHRLQLAQDAPGAADAVVEEALRQVPAT